jgi:hypothetical protein
MTKAIETVTPEAREWLAQYLFRVDAQGELRNGEDHVILALGVKESEYDPEFFRRGDLLTAEDQARAVADWLVGARNRWGIAPYLAASR